MGKEAWRESEVSLKDVQDQEHFPRRESRDARENDTFKGLKCPGIGAAGRVAR